RQQFNRDQLGKYKEKEHSEAEASLLVADPVTEVFTEDTEDIKYSFLADFETLEDQFNDDFEGVPNRFFNADLRGRAVDSPMSYYGCEDLEELRDVAGEIGPGHRLNPYIDDRLITGRLC